MKENITDKVNTGVKQGELAIEVTTRCNSYCLHCFARTGMSGHASLPAELVKEIIVEGYNVGYRHLHITGGEPLLWKSLFEILDHGFKVGYKTIFLNTNGTLITDDISKRFSEYEHFSFSVSLDGPEPLHDRIRGKGSYKKILLGIEKALNRDNDCTIFTTVTKSLISKLPPFLNDLYKSFPTITEFFLIQLIQTEENAFVLSDELLRPEDFIQLVQMVALLNVDGLRTVVKKNPLANIVSKLMGIPWIPRVPPLYRKGCILIMANREIGVVHSNRISFGRYTPGMIHKVLVSDGYQRTVDPDQVTCPECKYNQQCNENEMIRPMYGYGEHYSSTPFCRLVLDHVMSDHPYLESRTAKKNEFVY